MNFTKMFEVKMAATHRTENKKYEIVNLVFFFAN